LGEEIKELEVDVKESLQVNVDKFTEQRQSILVEGEMKIETTSIDRALVVKGIKDEFQDLYNDLAFHPKDNDVWQKCFDTHIERLKGWLDKI